MVAIGALLVVEPAVVLHVNAVLLALAVVGFPRFPLEHRLVPRGIEISAVGGKHPHPFLRPIVEPDPQIPAGLGYQVFDLPAKIFMTSQTAVEAYVWSTRLV